MPVHDWTRVVPDIFRHFHNSWMTAIADRFNGGLLPNEHYALIVRPHSSDAEPKAPLSHLAIFHASGDKVVAYIEIVSPGNKSSEHQTEKFLDKLTEAMSRGCHLLVIDLHPPTRRDPRGLHARFWEERFGQTDSPGVDELKPFGLMAYRSDVSPTAYFQRVSLGDQLPEMPIFLTPDVYVNVPLEATYAEAWSHVPARWRA